MKHIKSAAFAICLAGSVAVNAQRSGKVKPPEKVSEPAFITEFKKRNTEVKSIHWKKGNIIRIEKRDGTFESYDMDDAKAAAKAQDLYGPLPPAPPPPPKVDISNFTPPAPPPAPAKKLRGA